MYELREDRIYVACQRGDEEMSPLKPKQLGLMHGMVGGMIDVKDWGEKVVLSDYNMGETLWVELPRESKDMVLAALRPVGDDPLEKTYRRASAFVDYAALAPYVETQCTDFLTKVTAHKVAMPVLKMNGFPGVTVKDSSLLSVNGTGVKDVGQITQGNYTIGPVGADYPTWGGAGGFAAALGNMTGNLTGTQIGAVTETATAAYIITLWGFTLRCTSNNPHYGDPTGGHVTLCNVSNFIHLLSQEGPGTMILENLYLKWISAHHINNVMFDPVGVGVAHTIYIRDCLGDGNGALGDEFCRVGDDTPIVYVYNNMMWDMKTVGISANLSNAGNIYENNTAYNVPLGAAFHGQNRAGTWRNNSAYSSLNCYAGMVAATGRYNRSSDLTAANGNWAVGVGNTTGAVVANDVQSVNDADPAFFDIIAGGPLDGAGEANGIAARTTCIRGRAVPGPNGTSVGVAEVAFPGRLAPSHIANRAGSVGVY